MGCVLQGGDQVPEGANLTESSGARIRPGTREQRAQAQTSRLSWWLCRHSGSKLIGATGGRGRQHRAIRGMGQEAPSLLLGSFWFS